MVIEKSCIIEEYDVSEEKLIRWDLRKAYQTQLSTNEIKDSS